MIDHGKRVNLNISTAAWGSDGLADFFWPYSRVEILPARDHLLSTLVPLVRERVQDGQRTGLAVGLLFKWLIADLLKTFEALILASRFSRMPGIEVCIPNNFARLAALRAGRKPECDFFDQLARGSGRDTWAKLRLKRFIREMQWNRVSPKLVLPKGVRAKVAVQPTELTLRHARQSDTFLHYEQLGRWFGPMERNSLFAPLDEAGTSLSDEIASRLSETVEAAGETFHENAAEHAREWVICATNFVSFHLARLETKNDLPGELWAGCIGSSPWLVLLAHAVRQQGGRVIAHDHGLGDAHHDQLAHHFTNFQSCDVFCTYNAVNVAVKLQEMRPDLLVLGEPPEICALPGYEIPATRIIRREGKIKRLMYVPTAFHSEGARFRPILADVVYMDWQARLLDFLRKKGIEVIYKPHPEGRSRPPKGFAESFGFTTIYRRFEDIREPVDAYLIDFCSSSTTGTILRSELPVIYIDPGYPELLPDARELLERRCRILNAWEDEDNRLQVDWGTLGLVLEAEEQEFDTTFSDKYYADSRE